MLSDFKIKINQQDIDINFKSDIFRYSVELPKNNNFNILVDPVIFPINLFDFYKNYNRKQLSIDLFWFNNFNSKNPDDNLYHASTNFTELEAIINNYKKLENRDQTVTASYSDTQKEPLLRIVIKHKEDDIGDTVIVYEIHFTIRN